ncbi:MAG: hypothetical protein Q4D57_00300 [Clostridia bacterium]|nr:hypothetical protein [Clostridia bacterium]
MKHSRSYGSVLFVVGEIISIMFGLKIFYDNFPSDMMWAIIGASLVIFNVLSLRYYLK